jgi:hypothetical protein
VVHPTDAGTNWYELLGLPLNASRDDVAEKTERLSRQATALATTAPERSQQLRDTVRSIRADLLSGPAARARYDDRLSNVGPPPPTSAPPQAAAPGQASPQAESGTEQLINTLVNGIGPTAQRFRRFLQSGWTCPSCDAEGGPADRFCGHCGAPMRSQANQESFPKPTCPACSGSVGATDRFCGHCGAPLKPLVTQESVAKPTCLACSGALGPTDLFCGHCGAQVQ